MSKYLISSDPITKTKRSFYETAEGYVVESKHDYTDIIDRNVRLYNDYDERATWDGMKGEKFHWVASIPMPEYMKMVKSGLAHDDKRFLKALDDSDIRKFRTRPGRLSK